MIIITENITNKKIAYAKNDAEFTDSLFNPVNIDGAENNRGTLALFAKIENKKNAAILRIKKAAFGVNLARLTMVFFTSIHLQR